MYPLNEAGHAGCRGDGEHPDVVVANVAGRPKPDARIIVVANEKGGVGKSTIAFHVCMALADAELTVAAIDLDLRQQTLSHALQGREGTARRQRVVLPSPRQQVLQVQSGAMLCQEISRIGWDADVIVIDVAGHDSPIARRAIALADTLVTPVNTSFADLDVLARFHPVSLEVTAIGCFAGTVTALRTARQRAGMAALDWLVVPNRTRNDNSDHHGRFDASLQGLAAQLGFRLAPGLAERVAYRDLFLQGLTPFDLRRLPDAGRANPHVLREIAALVAELGIRAGAGAVPPADALELLADWQEAVGAVS